MNLCWFDGDSMLILWWMYVGLMMNLYWFYDGCILILWWIHVGFMMNVCWFDDEFMLILWWMDVDLMMTLYWFTRTTRKMMNNELENGVKINEILLNRNTKIELSWRRAHRFVGCAPFYVIHGKTPRTVEYSGCMLCCVFIDIKRQFPGGAGLSGGAGGLPWRGWGSFLEGLVFPGGAFLRGAGGLSWRGRRATVILDGCHGCQGEANADPQIWHRMLGIRITESLKQRLYELLILFQI